jgi:hypothetical protein
MPGSDRYRKPRLFVATLRYSRRSFRRVVWKSSQQVWAELHEQAWRYFGGSCRYVVLDNLKEGVTKPDLYEPALNSVYAATLAHYGVVADPARVRDPNRKGSVEHAIGHTQATALKGRRFESIEEQNSFLESWETRWAAPRIHGSTRRQVQAMFEEERPLLQSLPNQGMQYFIEARRTVCDDSCVLVDHSSYAARPAPIGSQVLVRIFERRIEIRDLTRRRCCAAMFVSTGPAPWCCRWTNASSTPRARRGASSHRPRPSAATPNSFASCCSPSRVASASASSGASCAWPSAIRDNWSSGPARRP